MQYLLDTNILSHLIRHPHGRIAEQIAKVGASEICTSIIVAAELRYGAAKRGSLRLSTQMEAVLGAIEILPFEAPADVAYAEIRTQLERAGTPIGGNDLLIAAHAKQLGLAVVTDNAREFSRVDGLSCVNWLGEAEGQKTRPHPRLLITCGSNVVGIMPAGAAQTNGIAFTGRCAV